MPVTLSGASRSVSALALSTVLTATVLAVPSGATTSAESHPRGMRHRAR